MDATKLEQCYNRGCGQKFNPEENNNDSCRHHPGDPVFHDAYKGWSCCNKKCTDFTEFLNIVGCTVSSHSNVKPPEPEKTKAKDVPDEIIEVKPLVPSALQRPPFKSPLTKMVPEIAPSKKQQILQKPELDVSLENGEILIGTACKNGGCGVIYQGPETNASTCIHHPGVPIFHEGMKYWSCCNRKTSDFNTFLNQIGCENGSHLWKKLGTENEVKCRWDHHQTASYVIVSIYAKEYCANTSVVKLNPIRLCADLVFPLESNATFKLDLELRGIVDVKNSKVSFMGTKVEIKLKKAEAGSWPRLEIPRENGDGDVKTKDAVDEITPSVEGVDLSDL